MDFNDAAPPHNERVLLEVAPTVSEKSFRLLAVGMVGWCIAEELLEECNSLPVLVLGMLDIDGLEFITPVGVSGSQKKPKVTGQGCWIVLLKVVAFSYKFFIFLELVKT